MAEVNVRDLRNALRELIGRAEAGEEIAILRRGKEVARLVPPVRRHRHFPDLSEFRASMRVEGEPLSEVVVRQRREARY